MFSGESQDSASVNTSRTLRDREPVTALPASSDKPMKTFMRTPDPPPADQVPEIILFPRRPSEQASVVENPSQESLPGRPAQHRVSRGRGDGRARFYCADALLTRASALGLFLQASA